VIDLRPGKRTYGVYFRERSAVEGLFEECLFCAARVPVDAYTSTTTDGETAQVTTYNCSNCGTYRKRGEEITRMPKLNEEQIKLLRDAIAERGQSTFAFSDQIRVPRSSFHGAIKGKAIAEVHLAAAIKALGLEQKWQEAGWVIPSLRLKAEQSRPPDTFDSMAAAKGLAPAVLPAIAVEHPSHYGGADNPYEAIKVIEAWQLNFCLGNAVKYIARAGKKPGSPTAVDLDKAIWYLQRERARL